MDELELRQLLPLIIPIVVIQLSLVVFALADWYKRPATRGPRWMWLAIILFVSLVGPIAYLVIGRDEA